MRARCVPARAKMKTNMLSRTRLRQTVTFAVMLLALFSFTSVKSYAQGVCVPCNSVTCPCNKCLQALPDPAPTDCNCPDTCYTWTLFNSCCSCITSITLSAVNGDTIKPCCVLVENATHSTWTVDSIKWDQVRLNAPAGTCLANGQAIQITTCNFHTGDAIGLNWTPADSPCINNGQSEVTTVP